MTENEENFLDQELQRTADLVGMVNIEHLYDYKFRAVEGMRRFGGSFMQGLAMALVSADMSNTVKILRVWRAELDEHELLYRIWEAKQRAANVLVEQSDADPRN